jgi:hypothetical protein
MYNFSLVVLNWNLGHLNSGNSSGEFYGDNTAVFMAIKSLMWLIGVVTVSGMLVFVPNKQARLFGRSVILIGFIISMFVWTKCPGFLVYDRGEYDVVYTMRSVLVCTTAVAQLILGLMMYRIFQMLKFD